MNYPDWKSAYDEVMRETDIPKLFKLVEIAEAAILTRRDVIAGIPDHHVERRALEERLHKLLRLKVDRLKCDWL